MDKQELVDRLVTAVEEGDVLYVLYWIKEMEKAGILEESLHSQRAFSSFPALNHPPVPFLLTASRSLTPVDLPQTPGNVTPPSTKPFRTRSTLFESLSSKFSFTSSTSRQRRVQRRRRCSSISPGRVK